MRSSIYGGERGCSKDPWLWKCCHVLSVACAMLSTADAVVTAPAHNGIEFESMPAMFGTTWVSNVEYRAHLQSLPSRPLLCEKELGVLHYRLLPTVSPQPLKPSDNLPIAMLVSRGGCSFEEKGRQAMFLENVAFVIVYDDQVRIPLVPMSASNPTNISVGMLFVSLATGLELKQMLDKESVNTTDHGGMIISLDARVYDSPYQPIYPDTEKWVLGCLSGLFALAACIGCLLVFSRAGWLRGDFPMMAGRERLMTQNDVLKLPTVDYGSRDETILDTAHPTCAICIEEYQCGDKLRQLPCKHEFHTECILPWLTERHSSCPLCKQSVRREVESIATPLHLESWWWRALLLPLGVPLGHFMVSSEDEDESVTTTFGAEQETTQNSNANGDTNIGDAVRD